MDFKRLENETDEQLVYRICSQKEIIGTWEDVADILNNLLGNNFSESAYRKKYQSFQRLLQENKSKFIEEDNYSKELDKKYEDIRKKHEIIIDFLCKTNIYNNEILWNIIASCKNKRVTDK